MKIIDCKVCREPERRRLIDADYAGGMSAAFIARRMTEAGWSISDETILKHLKEHFVPPTPEGAGRRRDIAAMVMERTADWLEREDEQGKKVGPESPVWKDALQPGLKAQQIVETRESKQDDRKAMFALAKLALGGGVGGSMLAPKRLTAGDDDTIEGEYEVLSPDGD